MAHDGLPEPLPVRPVLNPFALVLGALFGLAVTVLLQQAGRIVASTLFLILGAILGI
ncbi:MAG: hypothetical protein QOC71_198, partial [Thermoplasmata archaeon]|nr:hypothetical protein [Thermoplasmata archaeon]